MANCEHVLAATRQWIGRTVIGEGLCPFAGAPFMDNRVRMVCCALTDSDSIYRAFLAELETFLSLDPKLDETGLFVLSRGLTDFDAYLDMLENLQDALDELDLAGVLQLASFHPDYLFDGCGDDDPANYTNRSPYPIFHLIREDGLAAALKNHPDADSIPARNMARMRALGLETLQARLASLRAED